MTLLKWKLIPMHGWGTLCFLRVVMPILRKWLFISKLIFYMNCSIYHPCNDLIFKFHIRWNKIMTTYALNPFCALESGALILNTLFFHLNHKVLKNKYTLKWRAFSQLNHLSQCDFQTQWSDLYSAHFLWNCLHVNILAQVMAWCHQATRHYLSQCWPSSMT